jgi:phosphotriesterase-related protein
MSFASLDVDGRPLRSNTDLILHHEHLVCDVTCWVEHSDDPETHQPVTIADLEDVRRRPWAYPDNLRLDDAELVAAELEVIPVQAAAIVDVTPVDIGRSPEALRALAARTGLQVFMGCGRYVESTRPRESARHPDEYRDEILRDLLDGVGGIKAAVIGEIGTSNPITPLEKATLKGAARAQVQTGAPLLIHVDLWNPAASEALEIVEGEGADVTRTVLCHLDCSLLVRDLGYHTSLLERGAMLGFDTWGDELDYGGNQQPSDRQRIDALVAICERGYGERILHSHDICTKTQLVRYGGPGYRHLSATVVPMLQERGFTAADIDNLLLQPPSRLLGTIQ